MLERIRTSRPVEAWNRFSDSGPTLLAAAVAYNVFFSLAPLALVLLSVASLLGRDEVVRMELIEALAEIAPPEVVDLVDTVLDSAADVLAGSETLVIVVSLVIALYSGSRATVAVVRALTLIERLVDERPFWHRRLLGIGLTVVGGAAFLLAVLLILVGSNIADDVGKALSAPWVETVSSLATVPVVGGALFVYLAVVYRWGPPEPLARTWLGAAIGTMGALAISWGFTWFLARTGGVGGVVGAVATLAVLLIWLYLGALVIFIAAFAAGELKG